ncbi:hypothetical protein ScPMuIL_005115 [Solemya velum]
MTNLSGQTNGCICHPSNSRTIILLFVTGAFAHVNAADECMAGYTSIPTELRIEETAPPGYPILEFLLESDSEQWSLSVNPASLEKYFRLESNTSAIRLVLHETLDLEVNLTG